jgi:hypothetical protein
MSCCCSWTEDLRAQIVAAKFWARGIPERGKCSRKMRPVSRKQNAGGGGDGAAAASLGRRAPATAAAYGAGAATVTAAAQGPENMPAIVCIFK